MRSKVVAKLLRVDDGEPAGLFGQRAQAVVLQPQLVLQTTETEALHLLFGQAPVTAGVVGHAAAGAEFSSIR